MTHTLGPWEIRERPNSLSVGPTDNEFFDTAIPLGFNNDEARANARLIAAAPDLLAALKEMVGGLVATASLGLNDAEVDRLRRAEAAIAKAEGNLDANHTST